jgi:hypothetical protein
MPLCLKAQPPPSQVRWQPSMPLQSAHGLSATHTFGLRFLVLSALVIRAARPRQRTHAKSR